MNVCMGELIRCIGQMYVEEIILLSRSLVSDARFAWLVFKVC